MSRVVRSVFTLLPAISLLACFEDPAANTSQTDGDGDGDSTETSGDGDGDSGDGDGDGDSGDGDGDGDSGDGDGDAQLGPQIIASTPADGDMDAGLSPYFLLTFDRVVSAADAAGKILASQAGAEPVPVVIMPCPNAEPTCLAGIYPMAFAADGVLPSETAHQIVVTAEFPDTDGLTNSADQVIDFTTFFYQADWFEDAGNFEEVGGLAFHPGTDALFMSVHDTNTNPDGPIIRRIGVAGGAPQPAMTVATPAQNCCGPWTYGLDISADQLLSSMSYGSAVALYSIQGPVLTPLETITGTNLPAPYDTLDEVDAAARAQDGRYLFAFGDYFGGPNRIGIVQRQGNQQWSLFNDGAGLWADGDPGSTLAIGMIAGIEYLFVHNGDSIYQFRLSDDQFVQAHVLDDVHYDAHLQVAANRLFFGTQDGIQVFSVDANGFTQVARREGLEAGRFAVVMLNSTAHVYYADFRGDPVIGYTRFEF